MNEALIADLTALGLSQYESKCYLALLASYPAKPYQLSKKAGIPTAKIYEVVARLVERSMIAEVEGKDSGYIPKEPTIVLAEWRDRHQRLLERTARRLEQMRTQKPIHVAWNIEGRQEVIEQGHYLLSSAQATVSLAATPDLLEAWMSSLTALTATGVRIRLISYGDPGGEPALPMRTLKPLRGKRAATVLAVDQRVAFFVGPLEGGEAAGAWTDNPAIAAVAEEYIDDKLFIESAMENHWIMASDAD